MLFPMTEKALAIIARRCARSLVIRSYNESGSLDTWRECTVDEHAKLFNIAFAALLSLNFYGRVAGPELIKGVLECSEFTLQRFIPDANTYDSLYNKLRCVIDVWTDSVSGRPLQHWHYTGIRNLFPDELDYIDSWLEYAGEEILPLDSREDAQTQIDGMMECVDPDDQPPEDLQDPDIMRLLWNTWLRTPAQ